MIDIKVFIGCTSSDEVLDKYKLDASIISYSLAKLGLSLVFGGATSSSMGEAYKSFTHEDKDVISYTVPKFKSVLKDLDKSTNNLVDDTFLRTKALYDESDIILFLPGGLGTFAELFSILEEVRTSNKKDVIIYNQDGFYNDLMLLFNKLIKTNFLKEEIFTYIHVFNYKEDLIRYIKERIDNNE